METTWRKDSPTKPGLYNARVNGKETVLLFKHCIFSKKNYWMHIDGSDIEPNADVEWREGKIFD